MIAPGPHGKRVDICIFEGSNHSRDKISHRSRHDFLINVNTALVQRFSKKQSREETSVFGAKFLSMMQDTDALRGL